VITCRQFLPEFLFHYFILQDSGLVPADCGGKEVYTEGCTEKVKSLASEFEAVIIIVIVVVIVFEIICLAAACYSKKNDMVA
jgi:hypothetical protein